MMSCQALNRIRERLISTLTCIATVCCERRKECLSASGNTISLRIALGGYPTKHPSRTYWGDPQATRPIPSIIIRKLKRIGKGFLKPFLKKNNIILSLAKKSRSRHDLKTFTMIKSKASKNHSYSSSNICSSDSYSYSSLYSDSQ